MDRRSFLRTLIGGVAAAAAVRTFPFRVYSFPGQIALINPQTNFSLLIDPTLIRPAAQSLYDIYSVAEETQVESSFAFIARALAKRVHAPQI